MLRLDLLRSLLTSFGLLAGCSDSATSPAPAASKYVRYSGTVNQPAERFPRLQDLRRVDVRREWSVRERRGLGILTFP